MGLAKIIRKKRSTNDRVEERFQAVVGLIRDLDKKEFNRLKEGMELVWQGYNEVRRAKTKTEKQYEDIDKIEQELSIDEE